MDSKPWWASKTLWANIVGGAASLVPIVFHKDLGLDPETQTAIVGGIMALVNIVLRLTTKTAIGAS